MSSDTYQPSPSKRIGTPSSMSRELPKPRYAIGDSVILSIGSDRKYSRHLFLRHLVKKWRCRGRRLGSGGKAIVRECLAVFDAATRAEIAGIAAGGMDALDYAKMNECYIGGVPGASSPLSYRYQLLFRWVDDNGNKLAMVTGESIAFASWLSPASSKNSSKAV